MARTSGTQRHEEIRPDRLRIDTRSGLTKMFLGLKTTGGVTFAMVVLTFLTFFTVMLPLAVEMVLFLMWSIYLFWVRPGGKWDFPYRAPFHSGVFDGSYKGKKKGEGVAFFGIEISSKLEVWAAKPDIGTHILLIGTTGSGKTEALLGIVYNSLINLSGFAFIDGKGDPKLFENVFRLLKTLNRQIDLLQLSFLTGGANFSERQETKITNTCAPYSTGSDAVISELQISQMDDGGGKTDMWKGRAISFIQAINKVLVYQRDIGHLLLNPNAYIPYFDLPSLEKYALDLVSMDSIGAEIKYNNDPMFKQLVKPLANFVTTLPGYQPANKGQQEQKTLEQFGYITMQLTRLWNDMSYTYGHIYGTGLGEIYMYDVVLNRRVLVGAIPSLERSTDTSSMLGKIVIGQVKQMMGGALGNRVEGITRVIIDSRPTNAKFPFQVVLDEYGYYICVGFACAIAQSRSLGFSIVIATQDMSSLKKGSPEEADATWENTNIRMVGRITSGKESETWRKVSGLVDEADVEVIGGKEHIEGEFASSYRTIRDTRTEKRLRVTYEEIAGQENGEFTMFVGKKFKDGTQGVAIIRQRTFYTASKRPSEMRLNHFLPVEPPSVSEVNLAKAARLLSKALGAMIVDGTFAKAIPNNTNGITYTKGTSLERIKLLRQGIDFVKSNSTRFDSIESRSIGFTATTMAILAMARIQAQATQSDKIPAKNVQSLPPQTASPPSSQNTPVSMKATKSDAPPVHQPAVAVAVATPAVAPVAPVAPVAATSPVHAAVPVQVASKPTTDALPVAAAPQVTPPAIPATNSPVESEQPEVPVSPPKLEPRTVGTSASDALVKARVLAFFGELQEQSTPGFEEIENAEIDFEPVNISRLSGSTLSLAGGVAKITQAVECLYMSTAYATGSGMFSAKQASAQLVDEIDSATSYYQGTVPDPEPKDVFQDAINKIRLSTQTIAAQANTQVETDE